MECTETGHRPQRLAVDLTRDSGATVAVGGLPVGAVLAFADRDGTVVETVSAGVVADDVTSWVLTASDVAALDDAGAWAVNVTHGGVVLLAGRVRWYSAWSGSCGTDGTVRYVGGPPGPPGGPGVGVPTGGSVGQVLGKTGTGDFETGWVDQTGGGGGEGPQGPPGESAYEVAVAEGFEGTEAEWLASLVGPPGADGQDGSPGADGQDGQDGAPGADGASAYEVAVAGGFVGTEQDWLASLVGPPGADGADGERGLKGDPGADGADGADGHSPVVTWDGSVIVVDDTPGPDLRGPAGQDGKDGAKGDQGDPGPGIPAGGTTGQVLAKASASNLDTEWTDPPPSGVQSVVAGDGVTVDATDPANPVVSAEGGGGGSPLIASGGTTAATATHARGLAVGPGASTGASYDSVAVGASSSAPANSVSIGKGASSTVQSSGNVTIGADTLGGDINSSGNVIIGWKAKFLSYSAAVAVGAESGAGQLATALGKGAQAPQKGAVALGYNTTTTATDQVAVGPRDIEVQDATRGLILRSPDGTRWRLTVDDNGDLSTTAL